MGPLSDACLDEMEDDDLKIIFEAIKAGYGFLQQIAHGTAKHIDHEALLNR